MSNEPVAARESVIEPPGQRLRNAREAAGLGQNDVAAELRLGVETIDALEHDAVEKLPAPIFVRGYLRNYALLVGLPAQELVDAYNGSVGQGQAQGLMAGPVQQQLVGAKRRNYLVWLLVLAIALAAGWWLQQRRPALTDERAGTDQPASSEASRPEALTAGADSSAGAPAGTEGEYAEGASATPSELPPQAEPVTPPPEDVAPPAEAAPSQLAPPASAPAVSAEPPTPTASQPTAAQADTLLLVFSDRSWVEVRDATGERLVYRLADAGETRTVQGKAPFRLILGNAPAVRVELNGKPVDVASHTSGRTARFSVAP